MVHHKGMQTLQGLLQRMLYQSPSLAPQLQLRPCLQSPLQLLSGNMRIKNNTIKHAISIISSIFYPTRNLNKLTINPRASNTHIITINDMAVYDSNLRIHSKIIH